MSAKRKKSAKSTGKKAGLPPARLALIGFLTLIPPALLLVVHLLWHLDQPALWEQLLPLEDSLLGSLLIPLAVLLSPLVATACGLGLLLSGQRKILGWILLLGGPLLVIANFVARPS